MGENIRRAPYLDSTRSVRGSRARSAVAHDTRREAGAARRCVVDESARRRLALRGPRAREAGERHGPHDPHRRGDGLDAGRECPLRQRYPKVSDRGDAARHSGDHPRGELRRVPGARRDVLPASDWPGQYVGTAARRSDDDGDPRTDARGRCASFAGAGARCGTRSALGAHRGNLRRGSVSHLAYGRRLRPRSAGAGSRPAASSRPASTSSATVRRKAG